MKPEEDNRISPHFIPPATHNGRAVVDGEASENPIDVAAARAGITLQQAEICLQVLDETMNSGDQMLRGSLAEALREQKRQNDLEWVVWVGKILSLVYQYSRKQHEPKFIYMTFLTMGYVLGYTEETGVKSFADIALKLNLAQRQSGKATVTKCAAHFLEQLKLAPMLTQRTAAAREEMERARLAWIEKNKKFKCSTAPHDPHAKSL